MQNTIIQKKALESLNDQPKKNNVSSSSAILASIVRKWLRWWVGDLISATPNYLALWGEVSKAW